MAFFFQKVEKAEPVVVQKPDTDMMFGPGTYACVNRTERSFIHRAVLYVQKDTDKVGNWLSFSVMTPEGHPKERLLDDVSKALVKDHDRLEKELGEEHALTASALLYRLFTGSTIPRAFTAQEIRQGALAP